jgi:hypothetical protein
MSVHRTGVVPQILGFGLVAPTAVSRLGVLALLRKADGAACRHAISSTVASHEERLAAKRMHMRRFTRLTNAFSKKVEHHACAVALHAMSYNFVRIHQTLKVTPAMAVGVTDRLWEMSDVVEMLEAFEARA